MNPPTETVGGGPVRRRLLYKTRPEHERPELEDESEPVDQYQRVEVVDHDAPGMGGERTKLTLRPPEGYDIEDDTKEIKVDDLDMTEVFKMAQNEGLDPTAVEVGIRKVMKGLQDFGVHEEISEKEVKEQGLKVIDSRLVNQGKGRWYCESQIVCEGLRAQQERRLVCADAQPSDSQDFVDASTQKGLGHMSDGLRADIFFMHRLTVTQ